MFNLGNKDETKIFVIQVAIVFVISLAVISIFVFRSDESSSQFVDTSQGVTYGEESNVEFDRGVNFENNQEEEQIIEREERSYAYTKPTRITIDSIGVNSQILHPNSPRVDVLDAALDEGAVYYPGSGTIEDGNIFLFGHSTGFSVVQNQAYKTFNNLDDLTPGEEIELKAGGKTYVYEVETVKLVDADTAFVDLSRSGRRLTISTCHSFGQKSDRWVVDAVFKREIG